MAVTVKVKEVGCDRKKKWKRLKSKTMPFDQKVEVMHDGIGSSRAVDVQEPGSEKGRMRNERRFIDDQVGVRNVEESLVSATVIGGCDYERKSDWRRFDTDILHGAESCSNAINEYAFCSTGYRRPSSALTENVRKQLSYLGWKIEFMNKNVPRFRYTSPQGKTYQSLRQVCLVLGEPAMRIDSQNSQEKQRTLCSSHDAVPKSQVSEQEKTEPCHDDDDTVDIDREYCPHAVINYYSLGLDKKDHRRKDSVTSNLIAKAKKHLSFMGWVFWYANKKGKRELRYCSPKGRCYYSLRTACKACMDEGGASEGTSTCSPMKIMKVSEEAEVQVLAPAMIDMRMQKNLVQQNVESEKRPVKSSNRTQFDSRGIKRHGLQRVVSNSLRYHTQINGALEKLNNLDGNNRTPVLQSRKRARQVSISDSSNNPQNVLSQLIDNNVVLPMAKVHYSSQKDHHPIAEGHIACDGIKSSCCQEVFSPRGFEAHAGSSFHQSAANIFLEDGGSLLECQMQRVHDITGKSFTKESSHGKTGNRHQCNNDDICSVCHYGGDLVLCDQCPSSFHKSCVGLKELPEGDWFCPSCCCRICGENKFDEYSEEDNFIFSCHQCELQYHVGCVREQRHVKLETYPDGTWFCSTQCEKIFLGLQKLLGKPIAVGVDNLTWTLLKPMRSKRFDNIDIEATEVYRKLNIALKVMHECFEPVKEPHTGRDLVEDVIFCRESDLKHLNFRGFYAVLLERNDELISVATIRIYGEKVAEIPLVGTRVQYRRLGMCRILINEIEKKLMELGVERLTLPAATSVLDTWVTSFGFSKMTDSERLAFLDYTFLGFQDTVMCQKLLRKIPSTKSSQSTGPWLKHDTEFDRHSAESEVLQAEQIEEAAIVAEGTTDTTSAKGIDGSKSTASLATRLTDLEWEQCLDEDMLELLFKDDNHDGNSLEGLLKDDDHDENSLEGLLKDDNHDENILEYLLKNEKHDEHSLGGFLKDDNHETSKDDGGGYYKFYKRRRISAYGS